MIRSNDTTKASIFTGSPTAKGEQTPSTRQVVSPARLRSKNARRKVRDEPEKTPSSRPLAYIQIMIGTGKKERILFHENDDMNSIVNMICRKYGTVRKKTKSRDIRGGAEGGGADHRGKGG